MEEPTQQPNDNSKRQADSIETETELDAAILAAIERANEAHSVESSNDASGGYVDAGFDMVLIDPSQIIGSPDDEHEALSGSVSISPSVEEEMLSQFSADDSPSMLLGMMIEPSYEEYKAKDLSPQIPIPPPVEEIKLPQPESDDAVLGGQNPTLASSVVLGGLEGVKRRLASTAVESKIAAFKEALNYGQAGLDLMAQALKNESKFVTQAVFWQLHNYSDPLVQQALQEYNPYQFLECIFSGRLGWNGTHPIAISPDSQTLICGSKFDEFILWNLLTGKRQPTLITPLNSISCIAVSPDGLTLITGDWYGIIELWNLPTGEPKIILEGSSRMITSVAISPDGHTFVSGSEDGTIKVWNMHNGEEMSTLKGHSSGIGSIVISPDGLTLASCGLGRTTNFRKDRTLKVWNLYTGKPINILQGPSNVVYSLAISRDTQTLVSGSQDGAIKFWNLHTGKQLHTLRGHSKCVSSVVISPDGQTLVSGSDDETIKFWNLSDGKHLHTLEEGSPVSSIAISPDGQTLVSASHDGTVKVWR